MPAHDPPPAASPLPPTLSLVLGPPLGTGPGGGVLALSQGKVLQPHKAALLFPSLVLHRLSLPNPLAVAWSASVTPGGPGHSGVQGSKGDPLASVRAWHPLTHSSTHPPTLPSFHSSLADASSESAPQPCPQAVPWKPALTRGGRSAGQRSAPGASRDLLLGGWTARKTLE